MRPRHGAVNSESRGSSRDSAVPRPPKKESRNLGETKDRIYSKDRGESSGKQTVAQSESVNAADRKFRVKQSHEWLLGGGGIASTEMSTSNCRSLSPGGTTYSRGTSSWTTLIL